MAETRLKVPPRRADEAFGAAAPWEGSVRRRRTAAVAFGAWLALALALVPSGPRAADDEYAVKGAFLFHFAKFVTWPDSAFGSDPELAICLLGDEAVRDHLSATLDGRVAGEHPVRVRRLTDAGASAGCHMLFSTRGAGVAAGELATRAGPGVLTVGEEPGFAAAGGMINFVESDSKIRFEVNPEAARAAGLVVSARLLRLAEVVDGSEAP